MLIFTPDRRKEWGQV